jgi:hypothetical protein
VIRSTVRRVSVLVAVWALMLAPAAGALGAAGVVFAGDLPEPTPLPSLPPIDDPGAVSTRLIPIPTGCSAPKPEQLVFVGTLITNDAFTGRFHVDELRSGSPAGFEVASLIDIRYGDEVRFLRAGTKYLVGARIDPDLGVLVSTVRAPAPLFGGSDVAAIDQANVVCPKVDDPVRTLLADGTSVESGVLTPIKGAKRQIVRAIVQPVGVAIVVLVGLTCLKLLVFALGRTVRDLGVRHERQTRRGSTRLGEGDAMSGPFA